MKILITAGPTREPMDPVRYLSNRSSGKMGYAIAEAALRRGHEVALISGPVALEAPRGARVTRVMTAEDMLRAVEQQASSCDALVMAAAVADWKPVSCAPGKMKKTGKPFALRLVPTTDILNKIKPLKGARLFVGFAAETSRLVREAARKLREKNLDMIVANDVSSSESGFEVDDNRVILMARDGKKERCPLMSKKAVAEKIIRWMEAQRPASNKKNQKTFCKQLTQRKNPISLRTNKVR